MTNNNLTLVQAIHAHVVDTPGKTCLTFRDISNAATGGDDSYSYAELWATALSLAKMFDDFQAGDHVIIVMPLSPHLLMSHLAVLQRGGVASIFTHPSEKISRDVYIDKLRHALKILGPKTIVTDPQYYDDVCRAMGNASIPVIIFDKSKFAPAEDKLAWRHVDPDSTAVIQYSSGSTGMQKAVCLTHRMILLQCESYARAIQLDAQADHICSWLPMYHDMGLFTAWLMPIVLGVPVSLIDPFEWVKQPHSLLKLITDVKGTLCWLPNFSFNLLAQRYDPSTSDQLDLSSMRGFISCSEPVSAASLQLFYDAFQSVGVKKDRLWVCYAMAENAFAVTSENTDNPVLLLDIKAYSEGRVVRNTSGNGFPVVSCGAVIDGCTVKILDSKGVEVSADTIGEVSIKSPFLLREYYRNPEATSTAFTYDGWYKTGDLGFLYDNRLYITGRIKDLIIMGGRNFYPQDIERICDTCEGAIPGRSVALGMMDEKMGTEKVIVLVESKLEDAQQKNALSLEIRKRVFDQLDCAISDIRIVPHMWLLKTSSGKIARQPNLARYLSDLVEKSTFSANKKSSLEKIPFFSPLRLVPAMLGWGFILALLVYIAILTFSFGINQSWNIYMEF